MYFTAIGGRVLHTRTQGCPGSEHLGMPILPLVPPQPLSTRRGLGGPAAPSAAAGHPGVRHGCPWPGIMAQHQLLPEACGPEGQQAFPWLVILSTDPSGGIEEGATAQRRKLRPRGDGTVSQPGYIMGLSLILWVPVSPCPDKGQSGGVDIHSPGLPSSGQPQPT